MANANAQYAIDIAAAMSGGEQTIAQLDALTASLMGSGRNADHFQQAIVKVSAELDSARIASAAANSALAEGAAEYANLERAALQAGKAAERAALKNGGLVPPELLGKAVAADQALAGYTGTLRKLEADAKGATAEEARLAQTLDNVRKLSGHVNKSFTQQGERLEKLGGALNAVGGPFARLNALIVQPTKAFGGLSGAMGSATAMALLAAGAIAGVTAAVVALSAAVLAGATALGSWGVGLADTARSASLSREAFEALNPEIAAIRETIDAVSDATGKSVPELNTLAKSLDKAGVSAGDLPDALEAAALAEAALGKGGSAQFLEDIKKGERSVSSLAAATKAKLGGIVAKQMLGLGAQSAKLKKNLGEIFGGFNIEPVLAGFQTLVNLFDANTAAGEAMKFLFESVFQPIINQAERAAVVVEAFFLGFLIGAVKLFIALKPAINAVKEFFGFEDTSFTSTLDAARLAGEMLAPILLGMAVVVGGLLVAAFAAVALAIATVVAPIMLAISAFQALSAGVQAAWDFISSLNFSEIGASIIAGLVNGITSGAGAVLNAITGAVQGAIDGAKRLLGIASPSKVFAEIGVNTGEGFAAGVDDSADDAQGALAELTSPQDALANVSSPADAPRGGASAPSSAGGAGFDFSGAQFHFHGVKDAEQAEARFGEMLTRFLEGDALQVGAPAEVAP